MPAKAFVATVKTAWLCWLIAALLFFSGTKAPGLILLLTAAGFGLSAWAIARALTRPH